MFYYFGIKKTMNIFKFFIGVFIGLGIVLFPTIISSNVVADDTDYGSAAPPNPVFTEQIKSIQNLQSSKDQINFGYLPDAIDLRHLKNESSQTELYKTGLYDQLGAPPSSFDWRDSSKVTSVKNQNPCGTCWTFGNIAAIESRATISYGLNNTIDYSEQNLNTCMDPSFIYLVGNRCNGGGNDIRAQDTLVKKGARLESCQPYNTSTIDTEACNDSCVTQYRTTDWRYVAADDSTSTYRTAIKTAIQTDGPVTLAYYAEGFTGSHHYTGGIYYWPDCPNSPNHLVCAIGWDDSIAHPEGGGTGAWLVKNSWGTGYANNGYFWLCYGSANVCNFGSIKTIKPNNPNEKLYYWDEAGLVSSYGWNDTTGWMANIFTAESDGFLTSVDFWTTDNDVSYVVNVYLSGNINSLGSPVITQSGTCTEFGYYSIPLNTTVALSSGQSFTVAVKMITSGWGYPLPIERDLTSYYDTTIQTGKCYAKHYDTSTWYDAGGGDGQDYNFNLRARFSSSGNDRIGVASGRNSYMYFFLDRDDSGRWYYGDKKKGPFYYETDIPIIGDWNGDGIDEIGVASGRNGYMYFFLDISGDGRWGPGDKKKGPFYLSTDIPIIGDWNGDGIDEIGVASGRNGYMYFFLDKDNSGRWGPGDQKKGPFYLSTDTPIIGDWNGDGIDEIGVASGRNGYMYFFLDMDNSGRWYYGDVKKGPFYLSTDMPIIGDWNGDGIDEIGVASGRNGYMYFFQDRDNSGKWGPGDKKKGPFYYSTDTPIDGNWEQP